MADPIASSRHAIHVTPAPDPQQLVALGVSGWPIWSCGISTFPWTYDEQETCLLLEGEVCVTPEGGEPVHVGAGDLVVFAAGLRCTWEVNASRDALRGKLHAVAYSVSTRKALADLLPEFAKYLPADEAAALRTVPVVANVVADFVKAGWPKNKKAAA